LEASSTNVGRKSDGRLTSKAQPPLLQWQVVALHCNSWQRNATTRPAERSNSLLWRGWQSVVARCCGEADSGLQLAAAAMASNAATRDDGRQRAVALANVFVFFYSIVSKREREQDREKRDRASKLVSIL